MDNNTVDFLSAIRKAAGKENKLAPAVEVITKEEYAANRPMHTILGLDTAKEIKPLETFSLQVKLNASQLLGAEYAKSGKCFVFTGKAGTGKTTGAREIAKMLLKHGVLGKHSFYQGGGEYITSHSIAICAYTNRATDNIREALHKDPELEQELGNNVITIHKLLEFVPETYWNEEKQKECFRFAPRRGEKNKLDITHIIFEEASMIDAYTLWNYVYLAMRAGVVVIFLGDINQLPPIFGPSILNYALVNLPVIELTEVYRQAADSPILSNAHRCLEGKKLEPDGKFFKLIQSKPGSALVSQNKQGALLVNTIKRWIEKGEYDPKQDIILSPINKQQSAKTQIENACSTKMINYQIAHFLGEKTNVKVHHVIAGRNTWYLAEGDRVMINKKDGYIKTCNPNGLYRGKMPKSITHNINRFGHFVMDAGKTGEDSGEHDDFGLTGFENLDVSEIPDEEKKQASSHVVTIELDDGGTETLDTAGDFQDNVFSLGYALSVHKAQGCEWRRVIFVIHKDFSQLLFRELVYTAMTRAKEYLVIVDLSNSLDKAIANQRIKGNTLKEKIEWFNSKVSLEKVVPIIP